MRDDWPTLKPYIPPGHRVAINEFVKKIKTEQALLSHKTCGHSINKRESLTMLSKRQSCSENYATSKFTKPDPENLLDATKKIRFQIKN